MRIIDMHFKNKNAECLNNQIKVLIADDHELIRKAICRILEVEPGITVIGEATDGEQAVNLTAELRPEVVIMDIKMPKMDGIVATKKIKEKSSIQGIVVSSRRVYVYSDEIDQEIELENLLINLLDEHGPLTRNELVALTHIPRSTLYDNLAKMISKGVIKKESIPRSTRGRPKVLFKLV